jgi:hypothetical protein
MSQGLVHDEETQSQNKQGCCHGIYDKIAINPPVD